MIHELKEEDLKNEVYTIQEEIIFKSLKDLNFCNEEELISISDYDSIDIEEIKTRYYDRGNEYVFQFIFDVSDIELYSMIEDFDNIIKNKELIDLINTRIEEQNYNDGDFVYTMYKGFTTNTTINLILVIQK